MKSIVLLSSIDFECDDILALLGGRRKRVIGGKTVYRGRYAGRDILLAVSGIGKVNAASSLTAVVERYAVRAVINFGVGGAYPGAGLDIGDVAVASKEIYGDEGVRVGSGMRDMKEIGIPLVRRGRKRYFNEFRLDTRSLPALNDRNTENIMMRTGTFVTVSAVTGSPGRARELRKRFAAVCENMEGAAVAQVCAWYGLPVFEIRGISNIAGIRDRRRWDLGAASRNCQKIVIEIIKKL